MFVRGDYRLATKAALAASGEALLDRIARLGDKLRWSPTGRLSPDDERRLEALFAEVDDILDQLDRAASV